MPVLLDLCSVEGCERKRRTREWCSTHYERVRVHGDPLHQTWTKVCTIDGCGLPHKALGWCMKHYTRAKRLGDPLADVSYRGKYDGTELCASEVCDRPRRKREWCETCYRRWKKHGDAAVNLNPWGETGQPCAVCGGEIPPTVKSRQHCSGSCTRLASRASNGEATFLTRTDCIECGAYMPLEDFGGYRGRGNRLGRCMACADASPCPECGEPRKRSGNRLVCRPCRRPGATAEQLVRRARLADAICEHGGGCVTKLHVVAIRRGACFYCDQPAEHADHFVPLARGGKHCIDNIVAACAPCNLSKGDRDPWTWWESRVA